MNRKPSKQLLATSQTWRGVAGLTLVLLALIGWAGAVKSQAQTELPQTDQAHTIQDQPRKTNLTRGYKIIGGDMQVPQAYSPEAVFELNLWPNGIVYYEFDDNVTPAVAANYVAKFGVGFPVAYAPRDTVLSYLGLSVMERLAVPQVVIVDKKGMIRAQSEPLGSAELQNEANLRKLLTEFAAAK